MTADPIGAALETARGIAAEALENAMRAFAGHPNKYVAEQRDLAEIEAGIAAHKAQCAAEGEREAFEEFVSEGGKFPACARRCVDGEYQNPFSQTSRRAWCAALSWQARTASNVQPKGMPADTRTPDQKPTLRSSLTHAQSIVEELLNTTADDIGPSLVEQMRIFLELSDEALQTPAPAHATGRWTVISPDGKVFTGESAHRAANEANKHLRATDPAEAQKWAGMLDRLRAENEAENERLLSEHGTLNCPACGGSGHIGDVVQAPAVAPLTEEQLDEFASVCGFTDWSEWDGGAFQQLWYDFAREIERAHGIGISDVPVQGSER